METFITALHIFVGLVLIIVVLLQTGKGNAMGSAFGGSSQTVFGSSGAGNFFTKFTTGSAVVFMLTSLTLSAMSTHQKKASILTTGETPTETQSPAPSLPPLPVETGKKGSPDANTSIPLEEEATAIPSPATEDEGVTTK